MQLRQIFALPEITQALITGRRILNLLQFEDMHERFDDIPKAHSGTFTWALDAWSAGESISKADQAKGGQQDVQHSRTTYTAQKATKIGSESHPSNSILIVREKNVLAQWFRTGAGIFHLAGIPGCGKSTLMKSLWDSPTAMSYSVTWAQTRKLITARFFLSKKGSKKQKTISGLCRSLLHDILEECVDLAPNVVPELWEQASSTPWQVDLKYQLRKEYVCAALTTLLCDTSKSNTHCFLIFIDGLDELQEESSDYEDLVQLLRQWTQPGSEHVKLCVSSRPIHDFVDAFPEDQRLWVHHHTQKDHQLVLLDRLQAFTSRIDRSRSNEPQLDISGNMGDLLKFSDRLIGICSGDFRKLSSALRTIRQMTHEKLDNRPATGKLQPQSALDLSVLVDALNTLEPTLRRLDIIDLSDNTTAPTESHSLLDVRQITARDSSPASYRMLTHTSPLEDKESARLKQIQEIETYLDTSSSLDDDLFAAKDARMKGTCGWFTSKTTYGAWCDSTLQAPKLLWIVGKPAAGKSTLAGHIIENLQSGDKGCSYFFFKHANPSKSSLSFCLRSLASQMARQQASVREKLVNVIREAAGSVSENNNERLLWHKLFLSAIHKAELKEHFWVIDGLDECETSLNAFKTMLSNFDGSNYLRILVTSRDTQMLRSNFSELGQQYYHREEISTIDTLPDIRALVEARSKTLITMNDESRASLVEKIVAKSEGSFLWTSLVLKELSHSYNEAEINQVLEDVPQDMDLLYRRTLDMMSRSAGSKDVTKSIITWTACAVRLLKLNELEGALRFSGHDKITNLRATLQATCGQLVIIDRLENVQLVHETAREFLFKGDLNSEFAIERSKAHQQLTEACMRYLTSDEMKRPRSVRRMDVSSSKKKQAPFSAYACSNFSYHLLQADRSSTATIEALNDFLSANVLTWIEVVARTRNLNGLIQTSKQLKKFCTSCTAPGNLHNIQKWSTDLMRISARFADAIVACPPAIFALIPPLCPTNSAIYKTVQQGRGLRISGFSNSEWGNCLSCVDFRSPTTSLCHGHDYFAVGLSNGDVVLYRAGTGQEYKILHHGEVVSLLCFLNKSSLLASCGPKTIRIWDMGSGEAKYIMEAPKRCISLAYDEGMLLAACDKNYLASWDLHNEGQRQPDRPWHAGDDFTESQLRRPPSAISISVEHKMIAIASPGRPILLWSIDDDDYYGSCGKRLANGEPSKHLVTALVFNPISALELLAVSYLDGELVLLDPFNDETLETVRANCPKLAASPDGRLLAGAAGAGTVDVYGFESLRLVYRVKSSNLYVKQLDFSKDSLRFVDIRGLQCNVWEPAALRRVSIVWDLTETPASFIESHELSSKARVSALLLLPGQKKIVCGKHDGSVSVYDTESAQEISCLYRHKSKVRTFVFWKRKEAIISVDESNSIIAWSAPRTNREQPLLNNTREEIFSFRLDSPSAIVQLLLSAETERLIISTRESDHLYSLQSLREISSIKYDVSRVRLWSQHPTVADAVLQVDDDSIHLYKWLDWSLMSTTTLKLDMTGFQMKRIIHYMIGRNRKLLLEMSELHGGADTRRVLSLDSMNTTVSLIAPAADSTDTVGGAEQLSRGSFELSKAQLPPILASHISHIIDISSAQKMIFLDRQYWLCTLTLDQNIGKSTQYTRHFYVPNDWFSGSRGIIATLSERDVVFARSDGVAIVHGGFEFSSTVTVSAEGST
jgi:WD40 repeat protein/nucleoside-triphosphatase THEP1